MTINQEIPKYGSEVSKLLVAIIYTATTQGQKYCRISCFALLPTLFPPKHEFLCLSVTTGESIKATQLGY